MLNEYVQGEEMISLLLKRCSLFVLCFLVMSLDSQLFAQVNSAVLKAIESDAKGAGPSVSSGILAGKTLYMSAQDGRNTDGSVPKNFEQETTQSLRNVRGVLRAAGMDLDDMVWMTIYVTQVADVNRMNEVYWKTIGTSPPARTVLAVAALPNGENIQITCIAVSSTSHRQIINPLGWHQKPHSDPAGIQADDVLYISGQSGTDPVTGKRSADFGAEVRQALDNVVTILKTANMSMANVVWVNPYLSSTGTEEGVMNKIYSKYFEFGNTPARGTIEVLNLPNQDHIVFSCIAGANLAMRKSVRPRNEKPSATASPGVLYGDTLYLSAKDAYVPGLGLFSADLNVQARLSMRNLLDGLQEADMDFSNVALATIYMRNIKDAEQEHSIYGTFFKNAFPARTTLQQNSDTKDMSAEQISMIAVRQPIKNGSNVNR
jgi:enamine deaminase RidA (YjgF/YER057c/UK114 family)